MLWGSAWSFMVRVWVEGNLDALSGMSCADAGITAHISQEA